MNEAENNSFFCEFALVQKTKITIYDGLGDLIIAICMFLHNQPNIA